LEDKDLGESNHIVFPGDLLGRTVRALLALIAVDYVFVLKEVLHKSLQVVRTRNVFTFGDVEGKVQRTLIDKVLMSLRALND
jgi:hypothetical protein